MPRSAGSATDLLADAPESRLETRVHLPLFSRKIEKVLLEFRGIVTALIYCPIPLFGLLSPPMLTQSPFFKGKLFSESPLTLGS